MDEKIEKGDISVIKDEYSVPPTPPPDSDWRLGKYFEAMNNVEGYPDPPECEEIEGYISNCTDTDMDESASVLYAYNYLKEYVKHMKSAKQAKNNLMLVLPSQEGMTTNYKQDSDSSPVEHNNAQGIHRTTPREDDMDDDYDHLSTKEDTYYASMKMRPEYRPHLDVRRTSSDGPNKIGQRNGYAIPYITRHCNLPPNLRPPIQGTVSCDYPESKPRCEQAEVVEICSPSDTSFCSAPFWVHQRGKDSRIVYESIEKLELRHESDEYFIPRMKEKQSTTDSSNSHHHMEPESNRTNQKKRKSKRPNNRNKVYVTTNRVFHQPIMHSKECLDSLNSEEVRPCDCLKTVTVNQKKKSQYSPLKQVHVMESIQDGEISNFNTIMKKKLGRTRGLDDWEVPYPDFSKHKSLSPNNSSDYTHGDDFDTYDRASNHAYASRSLTSYTSSGQGNGSTNDSNSLFTQQSYTHQTYSPNKETFDDNSGEMSRSMMYMPSEKWNFSFVPYEPVKNGRQKVARFQSNDTNASNDNKSAERLATSGEFKSNSSFASKMSSKSDHSSSCSSRGSSSTSEPKERKHFSRIFLKTLSPKKLKPKSYSAKSSGRGQVSEL